MQKLGKRSFEIPLDLQPVLLCGETVLQFPDILVHFLQSLPPSSFCALFFNLQLSVGLLLEALVHGCFGLLLVIPHLLVTLEDFLRFQVVPLFGQSVAELVTVLILKVVRHKARLQVFLRFHHVQVFAEPLLFDLVLQECLIVLVLFLHGRHLSFVEEVAVFDVFVVLPDVTLFTPLVVRQFFLVLGQGVFNDQHRVVPVSEILISGVRPGLWLRLQHELVEAELELAVVHLLRRLLE